MRRCLLIKLLRTGRLSAHTQTMKDASGLPCFVYRLYDAQAELIYVGLTGNVGLRIGQHAAQKAWWNEVSGIEVDVHKTRRDAERAESELIRSHAPKHNTHKHPTNRAKVTTRRRPPSITTPASKPYAIVVTREDSSWLASVPEVPGAHTFARSLDGLAKSLREVIILMDDLAGNPAINLVFNYQVDDQLVCDAAKVGRDRTDLAARSIELQIAATDAARDLIAKGYSVRDAAHLLEMTPGRISQLVNS